MAQPAAPTTGLIASPLYAHHQTGAHPECPERLDAVNAGLAPLLPRLRRLAPRPATDDELALVHDRAYIDAVRREIATGRRQLSTGDTLLSPGSLDAALHATGGVLSAIDAVLAGKVANAFCAIRPPGHHATPAAGMGFCIFNHIAVAARYAQRRHGIGRVLIVDFDVHHGNGTQDAFYSDPSVLFFSSHQHPWYPGTGRRHETGRGEALGLTINAPLPAGSGFPEVLGEMETRLEKSLVSFRPELVLISAGFDSRLDDPLGRFTLIDEDFAALTHRIRAYANDFAAGRLVSLLEGGYNLATLGSAVAAHVNALAAP
jgi:acetoin utilization deacetylase AcuC-like enzyme